MIKVEGCYRIKIGKKEYGPFKNKVFEKGLRLMLSHLRNEMVADGYGAANVFPDWIHYGDGTKDEDKDDWHLQSFVGSVQISATGSTELVSDKVCKFKAVIPATGSDVFISELGLGISSSDPSSPTDYNNAVVGRAKIDPIVIKSDETSAEIEYEMTLTAT